MYSRVWAWALKSVPLRGFEGILERRRFVVAFVVDLPE